MELQAYLDLAISFLKAVGVPVAGAAVVIAVLIDVVFKRLPFWKDGYAPRANLALNVLFSAGLFVAGYFGKDAEYLAVLGQIGAVLTLGLGLFGGLLGAPYIHEKLLDAGLGKSLSEEAAEADYQEYLAKSKAKG